MNYKDPVASPMKELALSEAALFFDLSLDLLAIADLNGYLKRVNAAFSQTLGYSEAELLAQPFIEFVHQDDRPATLAELKNLQGGKPTLYFENRYRTKDGSYRWLAWTAAPQLKREVMYCIAHDVTQQKHREAALRESEERWQLALRGSNDGIWDWNVQTNEVFFSARWKTMLGYEEHEISNNVDEWAKRVHPDDLEWVMQVIQDHFDRKTPFYVSEHRVLCKDGTYKWILDRGQAIWDEAGNVLRMVGSHTDVTERRELQVALQRANQELEQRVAERTAQLEQANAALRESEDRNELAMEVARMFSFEWDSNTDAVKRSAQCASILGLTEGAAEKDTGASFFQRVHPEDRDRFVAGLQALTPENSTYKTTYRVVRPTGEMVMLEESGRAMFDQQGQLTRLIGMTADVTERQRLAAELEESRATLQRQLAEIETIYQSAPIGLNVLDTDLRFVRINQRLAEINGFSVAEHIGRKIQELLPDIADTAEALLCPILETGEPLLNVEIRGETPAQPGVQRVWLESFLPLKNGDRVIGINTVCQEITEQIQVEEALRQSEERFRHMADNAPVMVWVTDANGYCTYLSKSWYEFTGQTEATGLGFGWLDAVHPEDYALARETFINTNARHEAFRVEYRLRRHDGEYLWAIDTASPWFEADGQYKGYIGSVIDISDRKQAEEALRENEDRLRMAIASAKLGTWDWNLVTGELKWDTGCKAMFGLPPDAESSIEVFFEGLHPDDRDRLQEIVQATLDPASGGSYDTEYRTIGLQDKVERWLRAKGQAYYDPNGKPLRFSGTVLNITEQKQVEAQREQLLQQEQAAREAAEHANRMKDEFLAVLSHELRTPLNPILGWAKLLQLPQIGSDKLQQGLRTIERNAKQQVQLIEDLLDISRIIRGQITLNLAAIALSEPIAAALETVRLAGEAKAIQMEVFLDPSVGQVRGDAGRLQQVVWNLLSNAIKFTPTGGRVTVQLTQVNRHAQIQVSDTGKGIQPDFLPHVFELFRQQDSSTTRAFGGLGLGLAIARQVVEAHGGTITAASPGEGQGATFTVQLPLIPAPSPDAPNFLNHQTLNFDNLQVVVVDDEPDSLELVKVVLDQEGAVVRVVSSGTAALEVLRQEQFDLLISDIGMPEMDGYSFIRQVRALPPQCNRNIPAIALTAYAGETNRRQILAAGFQAHVAKPIDPQQLLDAIAAIISTY
ncbi:MAG TPA: hybrid sensor histidine kinase/response regulator [Cyanobacteria bacterium UBA8803]|nr:hybrid sensor histidine kinase/response regulator [Cyanobacteria bacterium UBA9273]HBL59634.1 hybrid sensor histidine kinase/response regulator [Cyanobacteria bacterium UBA8803]